MAVRCIWAPPQRATAQTTVSTEFASRAKNRERALPSIAIMIPVARTLERIERFIPTPLVSHGALDRIVAIAERIPASLADWLYLECRLARDVSRTDLIIGVDGSNAAQWALPSLLDDWTAPAPALQAQLERIWLEYDLDDAGDGMAAKPGIFFDFAESACASAADARALVHACFEHVSGTEVSQAMDASLLRCLDELPVGTFLPFLGWFPSRNASRIRICLANISGDAIPSYLDAIGWPGATDHIKALLSDCQSSHAPLLGVLHLDIGDDVDPNLAIEFVLDRAAQARGNVAEGEFIDKLVDLGVCDADKARALRSWPGCSVERLDHELWPSVVVRHINHVKLVLDAYNQLSAKAYLALHGSWMPALQRQR